MPYQPANGINIYYETYGKGQPVLFLHGALVDHTMWQPQVQALQDHCELILCDLRGHGKTGSTLARKYTPQRYADDILAFLDALGHKTVVLCGLSLGGMIAQTFASLYEERLIALVLCDTAASVTLTASDKLQTYLFGWSLAPTVRLLGAQRFVDYSLAMAGWMRGGAWLGNIPETKNYVAEHMRRFSTDEMAKIYSMIASFQEQPLDGLSLPTLIMLGEYEDKSIHHHSRFLQQKIPGAQLSVIPNAGHLSNWENPEFFNRRLLNFLQTL